MNVTSKGVAAAAAAVRDEESISERDIPTQILGDESAPSPVGTVGTALKSHAASSP